jgi:hypothetical protein
MPIRNELLGVFKTLRVGGSRFVLAERASRRRAMEADAKAYVQGTPKTRVMNIGGAEEVIDLQVPILVGSAANLDGRSLLVEQIRNALQPRDAVLPLITRASVQVNESGANISLSLLSDGDPTQPPVFEVLDDVPSGTSYGNDVPSVRLDPTLNDPFPTRVARFYDFRVNLAGFYMFVQEANIEVNVQTTKNYFIQGAPAGHAPNDPAQDLSRNWGTQFPYIGVSGITISGTGTAAVLLDDLNADYDFADNDYPYPWQEGDESLNINTSTGTGADSEITLQTPGQTVTVPSDFALEIYNHTGGAWESLFYDADTATDVVDLSRSVVRSATFNVTTGLLTVNFEFFCYVK